MRPIRIGLPGAAPLVGKTLGITRTERAVVVERTVRAARHQQGDYPPPPGAVPTRTVGTAPKPPGARVDRRTWAAVWIGAVILGLACVFVGVQWVSQIQP